MVSDLCTLPSQKFQSERFVEARRYPSTDVQTPLSSAILLIAIIVYAMKFDSRVAIMETFFLFASASIVLLTLGLPQILRFNDIIKSLESKNNYLIEKKSFTIFSNTLSILFLALLVIGPFLLSSIVSPAEWFGSVLGLIIGFSLYQLVYPVYVRRWEKNKGLQLEYYEIWAYNMDNKKVVIERGVREKTALP
jgi:hypothetical protein